MEKSINLLTLTGRPKNKLVQLALDINKVKPEKLSWPMLWSPKLDGVYCIALKKDNKVTIYSRTGEIFTSMRHLENGFMKYMVENEVVIFEAYKHGTEQSVISGWCRDTKEQHIELDAGCHDLLTLSEFIDGGIKPYEQRFAVLRDRLRAGHSDSLYTLNQFLVHDLLDAKGTTSVFIKTEEVEGGIIRNPKGLYDPGKRTSDIIKIKQGVSYDLQVLDVYEGKGKYAWNLGGLICRWKQGEIRISGMTDAQRQEWWNNPGAIIGKIVQVDAMCESSKGLLREPRFKGDSL